MASKKVGGDNDGLEKSEKTEWAKLTILQWNNGLSYGLPCISCCALLGVCTGFDKLMFSYASIVHDDKPMLSLESAMAYKDVVARVQAVCECTFTVASMRIVFL